MVIKSILNYKFVTNIKNELQKRFANLFISKPSTYNLIGRSNW